MESKRMSKMSTLFSYLIYPVLMLSGICLYLSFVSAGVAGELAVIAAISLAAICIVTLEYVLPYKKQWWPKWQTILNDLLFMAAIQMLLPRIVAYLAILVLMDVFGGMGDDSFWPSHLPIWVQVCAMILVADFFRYWLHRLAHEWEPLWRFHAVHHAPTGLYWLNVGRFHPVDKGLQLFCDALPFIVLGVGQEVLNIYFVCYAVNGFVQHCNINLKLGVLNYIISGPELHRWHHSTIIEESNTNYGNNLIVWDLLFGTRYLPSDRSVQMLGLKNTAYPQGFVSQMRTPFVSGMDKQDYLLPPMRTLWINTCIWLGVKLKGQRRFKQLKKMAADPRTSQLKTLTGCD